MVNEIKRYISDLNPDIVFATREFAEEWEATYGVFYKLLDKLLNLNEKHEYDAKLTDEKFKKKVEKIFEEAKTAFLNYMDNKHYPKKDKEKLTEKCKLEHEGLRHIATTYGFADNEEIEIIGTVFYWIDELYFC